MEDDSDFGRFPGLPRTLALGVVLAGLIGGLYLFAASYHAPGGGSLAYRNGDSVTTALLRSNPPQRSGS